MRRLLAAAFYGCCSLAVTPVAAAQERGAARLHSLVAGLTVTPRVLVIGVHPDDDDPQLITWLARGHHVQTAYVSLTRGEAGQNFAGPESGGALGVVRTQEMLAARRIDGGEQYFTRAIDFGISKNAEDTFKHWPKHLVVGDLVAIIRSFRPHVVVAVFPEGRSDGNGQHDALGIVAREAFYAAGDTTRVPASGIFGPPWKPLKYYRHGRGIELNLGAYDKVAGKALADIATESRTQHRSQGLSAGALRRINFTLITRVASWVNDSTPPATERSIFDGIDTTFARLSANAPPAVTEGLATLVAAADSTRALLNLAKPDDVVPLLARVAKAATEVRDAARWCHRPSPEAAAPSLPLTLDQLETALAPCDQNALDLEASIDLVQRRVNEAVLLAAGLMFESAADRELIASTDTLPITLTMYNRGARAVKLIDVSMSGALPTRPDTTVIPPDSAGRRFRMVTGLVNGHPWWLGQRDPTHPGMFMMGFASLDGLDRGAADLASFGIMSVAMPEGMRRESDVTVTVEIEGATIKRSLGPAIFRTGDPVLGVQSRPVAGAPTVSLAFERVLEWMPANKPIARQIRLQVKSLSDREQRFKLNLLAPKGVVLDSVPDEVVLAPREQTELFLRARAVIEPNLHTFAVIGNTANGERLTTGFRTLQYTYFNPQRFFRTSGFHLRGVEITVPPKLEAVYVAGSGDDTPNALKGVGVSMAVVTPEDLLSVDLAKVSTLVIGPRAYDGYPQLIDQSPRFLEFARKGGTVVVLEHANLPSRVLPYPIVVARPFAEHVTTPTAPVATLVPTARVFAWPNKIYATDWNGWAGERARYVPTTVDPRWTSLLELHDPGEKENRNSLLVAKVGKGNYVLTSLTLTSQIDAAVPGALRLLVNLMSAGLSPERATASR